MKKTIIFGAGFQGRRLLEKLGHDRVAYFVDNSLDKQGMVYCEKPVYSPTRLLEESDFEIEIAISTDPERMQMQKQLVDMGVTAFSVVKNRHFASGMIQLTEQDKIMQNDSDSMKEKRKRISNYVEEYLNHQPLFQLIQIETINRCNGTCEFCPANVHSKTMEKQIMSWGLFESIVDQLSQLQYKGYFSIFANNEPFLDKRIVELYKYARKKLSEAYIYVYTNGTLLTPEKFKEIMNYVDELQINNYNRELRLNPSTERLLEYCEEHGELKEKFMVTIRMPQEILTSRAGTSPNRKEKVSYAEDKCVLPYTQMIVRPDGKVSLCCNDALGKNTLGDLSQESIVDVWFGEKFKKVRESLAKGRGYIDSCRYCDSFILNTRKEGVTKLT